MKPILVSFLQRDLKWWLHLISFLIVLSQIAQPPPNPRAVVVIVGVEACMIVAGDRPPFYTLPYTHGGPMGQVLCCVRLYTLSNNYVFSFSLLFRNVYRKIVHLSIHFESVSWEGYVLKQQSFGECMLSMLAVVDANWLQLTISSTILDASVTMSVCSYGPTCSREVALMKITNECI